MNISHCSRLGSDICTRKIWKYDQKSENQQHVDVHISKNVLESSVSDSRYTFYNPPSLKKDSGIFQPKPYFSNF